MSVSSRTVPALAAVVIAGCLSGAPYDVAGGSGSGTGTGGSTAGGSSGQSGSTSADSATTGTAGPITITVGQWNLNWFGDPQNGPSDDDLQQTNVTSVLVDNPAPLWALVEVVDIGRLQSVADALGGYEVVNARSTAVAHHSDYRGDEQTALLYDPSIVSVRSAQIALGNDYYDFAERPPLELALDLQTETGTVALTVLVIHMKAYADKASYDRRVAAAGELKAYLDYNHPDDRVMVVGDFNDDLDSSDYNSMASPYAAFVKDTAHYDFPTMVFTQKGIGTYVGHVNPIDHQLVTNELTSAVVAGSQTVIKPSIPSYRDTTTDHYPVQVTYHIL